MDKFKISLGYVLMKHCFYSFIYFIFMTCHNWALTAEKNYHLEAADDLEPSKRLTSLALACEVSIVN